MHANLTFTERLLRFSPMAVSRSRLTNGYACRRSRSSIVPCPHGGHRCARCGGHVIVREFLPAGRDEAMARKYVLGLWLHQDHDGISSKTHTYLIAGGQGGCCNLGGGVSEEVKARCLTRMQCWFRLSMDVCEGEWPYYEAVSACSAFDMRDDGRSAPWFADGTDHETQQTNGLQRLSNIFGCQPEEVESQYRRHLPIVASRN